MKVTTTDTPNVKATGYPKLMTTGKGTIVLMTSHEKGVVLESKTHPTGNYSTDWCMDFFVDYTGIVTLEN